MLLTQAEFKSYEMSGYSGLRQDDTGRLNLT